MCSTRMSLASYLRMLYDMESSVYQQEELIKQLSAAKVPLPSLPPSDKGKPVYKKKKFFSKGVKVIGLGAFFITVVLIICSPQNWLNTIIGVLFNLGLLAIFYLCFLAYDSISGKAKNKQDIVQWEIDNVRRREYAAAIAKRRYINNEIQLATSKVTWSKQLLDQIYASGVIYPKYRNLPAISSFLDYFSSGRCSSLTGPHGAYNLYESEVRLDGIITHLDRISRQLNQIQFNQQMLYYAMKDCEETVNRLCRAVENSADHLSQIAASQSKIEENSAMAAYRAKLLEKESAYRNQMQYGVDFV